VDLHNRQTRFNFQMAIVIILDLSYRSSSPQPNKPTFYHAIEEGLRQRGFDFTTRQLTSTLRTMIGYGWLVAIKPGERYFDAAYLLKRKGYDHFSALIDLPF